MAGLVPPLSLRPRSRTGGHALGRPLCGAEAHGASHRRRSLGHARIVRENPGRRQHDETGVLARSWSAFRGSVRRTDIASPRYRSSRRCQQLTGRTC
eukprot:1765853-Rhodomonas_salina.1